MYEYCVLYEYSINNVLAKCETLFLTERGSKGWVVAYKIKMLAQTP